MLSVIELSILLVATCSRWAGGLPRFVPSAGDHIKVGYRSSVRMGAVIKDYTRLEISVATAGALEDSLGLARGGVTIELMSGPRENGRWVVVESRPSIRGGVYTWTQAKVSPCLEHRVRVWVLDSAGSQASFEWPHTLPPVTVQELLDSGYRPPAPEELTIDTGAEVGVVSVTWGHVHCAELYDVTYTSVTDNKPWSVQVSSPHVQLREGIQSCVEYDLTIVTVIQGVYSRDASATFITPPLRDSGLTLDPIVLPGSSSITAQWRGFERLSCINKYQVTVCKEGNECPESVTLVRDDSLLMTEFTSSVPLDLCTDYSLHIKPLWTATDLYEKVVSFRTLSPPLTNLTRHLRASSVQVQGKQVVVVRWAAITCADQYKVYAKYQDNQHDNLDTRAWELIGVTSKTYFHHSTMACTEYRFGLAITVGEEESEIVSLEETVMTNIDNDVIFTPPNIKMNVSSHSVQLTWDHRKCITGYRIRLCSLATVQCYEAQEVMVTSDRGHVTHTIGDLEPCSEYSLSIHPSTGEGELDSASVSVVTRPPPPRPPASVQVGLNTRGDKVDITWSKVQCATGYRIHQRLHGDSELETVWVAQHGLHLYLSLDSPEPCVNYSYGLSSLVGDKESHPSHWQNIPVPPRFDNSEQIEILSAVNGTLDFAINKGVKNQNCKVEKYKIRHDGKEYTLDPDTDIKAGKIRIKVKNPNSKFEASLKYHGHANWTQWISPETGKRSALYLGTNIVSLLPFLVTLVIILVSLCLLILCITQVIKRSRLKYDEEVARVNEDCVDIQRHLNDKYFSQ